MTAATCGWVTMSMRELDRLKVIEAIIEGRFVVVNPSRTVG